MALLTTEELHDHEGIRLLVARYADAVNRRADDELSQLFVPDGEWLVPGFGTTAGREDIAKLLRTLVGNFEVLVQAVHQGVIDVSGDQATGRWYLSETGIDNNANPVNFMGVYHDWMVRTDDGWAFTRRKFDFLYRKVGHELLKGYSFPDVTG